MEFRYVKPTGLSVAEAIAALEAGLARQKFSVLWHLDMKAKLKEKGLELGPEFHVFEVCNAPRAKEALEANLAVGFFLPCKMAVYVENGVTYVGMLRPELLIELLGEVKLQKLATEVEAELRAVVDEVAV